MTDLKDSSTEHLWDVVRGRPAPRGKDGLLRSLCWGNRDAWDAMAALLEIVDRQEARITALEAHRGAATGDPPRLVVPSDT